MLAVLDCSYNRHRQWLGAEAQWVAAGEGTANFFPAVKSSLPCSQSLLVVEEERTSVLQASSHPQQVSSPGWLRFTGAGGGGVSLPELPPANNHRAFQYPVGGEAPTLLS